MVPLEFFVDINPSGRIMAVGSTQPLTEVRARNISWSKNGQYVGLPLPLSFADGHEIWEPQTSVNLRVSSGLPRPRFAFYLNVLTTLSVAKLMQRL
jgi:hypothetical protein